MLLYNTPVQHREPRRRFIAVRATYSEARARLAQIWNEVEESREPAILERRGHEDMALLPADELASLSETAHLLSSPRNAARLLAALTRSRRGETVPVDLETLARELGLEESGRREEFRSSPNAWRTSSTGIERTAKLPSASCD